MNQAKYTNRYGDDILFTELSKTEIEISGFTHYRRSEGFIDPSGGPYIEVGTDIGRYFNDKKVRRVSSIGYDNEKIILIIK